MSHVLLYPARRFDFLFDQTDPFFPPNDLAENNVCDIPTRNPDVFLCRQSHNPTVRWHPLIHNDPNGFLRAMQQRALIEGSRRSELSSSDNSEPGTLESGLRWLVNQVRNMGNGLHPPALGGAPFLFGCASRRPFHQNPPPVPAPPVPVAPRPPVSAPDAAVSPLPSGMRELRPGIALADFERDIEPGRRARVTVLRLDLSRVDLSLIELAGHRFGEVVQNPNIDAAVNGGFFEFGRTLRASGLMVQNGLEISPAQHRGGSGVLVVHGGRARLVSFEAIDESVGRADFALQCGPRLIETDGSVGIYRDDGRFNRRTAACIRDEGRTLDLVVAYEREVAVDTRQDVLPTTDPRVRRGGPTLFMLAHWLHEGLIPGDRGCESALNLDGGPSTAIHVRGVPDVDHIPRGVVVWAVGARARRR